MVKKALLIGLNYKGTTNSLNGCENDIKNMKTCFTKAFNVSEDNIVMKTDGDLTIDRGLIFYLKELVKDSSSGSTLLFHFSGHGLQIPDDNGDEQDGLDEAIFTMNENIHTIVRDDEIANVLKTIPSGVKVIMIFDCCHSGSMADLSYQYSNSKEYRYAQYENFKCDVISISGCQDHDVSADAYNSEKRDFFGALTMNLIPIFERMNEKTTWKDVINETATNIKKGGYSQVPQFASTSQSLLRSKVL